MWTLDSSAALPLWRPAASPPRVTMAFTTRRGGVSEPPFDSLNLGRSTPDRGEAVVENRRRLLDSLALDPMRVATAGQVHGASAVEVGGPGHVPGCDALVTRAPGLTLAVTVADCLPLIMLVPGATGVAHSGWRGTAAGMPRRALEATCAAGAAPPEDATIHLGPCIRACCYEVGPEVARQFPAAAVRERAGHWRLDLAAAARQQLLEAGVPAAAIFDTVACTACEPSWYFSHRRDHGRSGRHWALVAITS